MITSRGIVLNAVRYSDDKVIVNVFTAEAGTVAFVVRRGGSGGRTGRGGRVRAALWQPLTVVDVTWREPRRGDLAVASEVGMARVWTDIPYHPHKAAMALFVGEFLGCVLRQEQADARLLAWLEASLAWLDGAREGFASFHVVLLLGLSRFLGFAPNIGGWREGAFFDLRAAEYTQCRPLHPDYLEGEEAALVPRLLRLGYGNMRRVGLNGRARSRMLEVIVTYYRLHVADFPPLRSLDVLRATFS
ncbi:MAG: recombination protein O N-terminal domain-containing protein [Bacteroidaceae bacterium]|nr:recombination protein O N-terminal domain-containing protein [Bacteroidaceae bacterium]